jgi:hypothetical protein
MNKEDFDSSMKHNGFKVPENYFEQLDERVLQQLPRTHKPGTLFLPLMKKMSVAAAIFLASGIAVFLYQQNKQNTLSIDNANIAETEYQEFQNNIEINDDELTEVLSNQFVDSLYKAEVLSVSKPSDTNTDELESVEEEYSPLDEIEI